MAELVLSPILELLFEKLASAAVKKFASYVGIHSKVKSWEKSLQEIRALLNDATCQEITKESVKRWLNRLQHLAYDIDDVLNELAAEAMDRELTEQSRPITSKVRKLIPTCCTSFSLSFRMHDKLNNITTELQALENDKRTLGLVVITGGPIKRNRKYEISLLDSTIVGREGEKEALLYKLLGDETCHQNYNIVPIVGMGGVGKTTLARLLYNETKVQNHFELKAWVCVSDEFDIFKISKSIFESMNGENKEFTDLNLLQVALREKLNEKRFLLVLDDVWSESDGDWDNLVRPFHAGAPGSKIIVTTRKEQLLKKLGYDHLNPLQSLSFDDALSLFCQHALGVNNFDSHPMLRPHGEGIVKKCGGLPLALRALGRLLRTKTDEEEWEQLLNNEIWTLPKEDEIVPALRLSYHDLNARLKQLFAYCSLFPKDYMFDKEELVLLWTAEGFLHQSTASTSTEESLGREYFEELLSRSFLQRAPNDESLFVMHDLMNDLATSVAEDFFVRSDNEIQKDVTKDALKKYRHMSFVWEEYMEYNKFKAFEGAKNLRTFLALSVGTKRSWERFFISDRILTDLHHEFPLLRVLCLSYFEIKGVPESIGSLKHLRYLNLCRTGITHLPENVCNLYNLQTLILFGCRKLTKLPNNFSKLKYLRHLDVRDTPLLNEMPLGISELKSLQTLSKVIIGGDNGFAITMLKDLKNLRGEISIKGLDKVQNAMHAREANLSQKRLTELEVEWSEVFDGSRKETLEEDILNVLEPRNANLKKLGIVSYGGIMFPNWVGDASFIWLTHVSIHGCRKCTSLPPLGQLPSLKELFLQGMDGVKVVGLQLHGNGVAFPSLEILSFVDMQGWEVWSTNRGVVDAVFPCLREISISSCPNLVEVSLEALPSLRVLKISRCGHGVLRSLVCVASSVSKLEIDSISGLTYVLWRGVKEHLGAVEELQIGFCNEIRYLWESEAKASKFLPSLRKLEVRWCEKLVSLGEKEEDNCGSNLTSLRILQVWDCKNMERCNCPNSIETLDIKYCSSIMSVSFPTGGHKLKSLCIWDCEKLLENELFINPSKPMLEVVVIGHSSNLKSIMDLSCFIHLTSLVIEDCPSLEAFPDGELQNLTSLKNMIIIKCPSMDTSFPRGLWPPKLCYLEIGELKKPISEWGPQNFPTSLVTLRLRGGSSEEDVSSCSQLSLQHLLPSSLTCLSIEEFEKLESLSMGLQHLTSLQRLYIENCPKMIHLPEMLFSGLLSLSIYKSPNLEERWSRRGSNWHLISHIPRINGLVKE